MASGYQHAIGADVAIYVGAVAGVTAVASGAVSPLVAGLLVGGLVIGKYANPDVRDLEGVQTHAEALVYRKLGCIVGTLWHLLWHPVAVFIPHRHWASHLPVVATLIAWLWLTWLPLALCAALAPSWFAVALVMALLLLPGWTVQDVIHLAQDGWRIRW